MKAIVNRLKRLEGQLARVRTEIESESVCSDVIPQLLATKGALDSTIREYVIESLKVCPSKAKSEETQLLIETIIKKL
jgi:DNA-binding FrmR family transcriptional regulator